MEECGRIGFRIVTGCPRPDPSLVEGFRGAASSNVADAMGRFNFMCSDMRSRTSFPVCGPAVTVTVRPGDNLMVHKALQLAGPGDVIVVSTNHNMSSAVFGELMCRSAVGARLGGLVVQGAVRDVEAMRELGFPVFSTAVSPGGCDKDGPGEINVPIACGNVVVEPGDVVVGDSDGVAVVPLRHAAEVLANVRAIVEREQRRIAEIDGGQLFRSEINEILRRANVLEPATTR